jgi:hypothetical protein
VKSSRTIYLRPSSAHLWRRCAGYAAIMSAVTVALGDEADNDVREDGTATHWLSAETWSKGDAWPDWVFPALGSMSPNGREITEELTRGAGEYLDELASWGHPDHTRIESPLPTGAVFPGTQDGTPDAYQVLPWSPLGRLADLKMGFRVVEVWRNDQLIVYGWTLFCLFPHLMELELIIVQPRAAHPERSVRTWRVSREEMRPLAEALQAAALNAHADDPVCVVNDGCRNCGAAHACRTLAAAGGAGVDTSYDATPFELTSVELGYELTKLQQAAQHMEHRITGLTAQAESIIRTGKTVPGFELSRRATRYRWPEEKQAEVEQLGKLLNVEVHEPPKLKSPAKLRNVFPGLDVQAMYAERPTGELTLKAIDPQQAIKAFTHRK